MERSPRFSDGFPMRRFQSDLCGFLERPFSVNPAVMFLSLCFLVANVVFSSVYPVESNQILVHLKSDVTKHFTWLFQGSRGVFFCFLLWVGYKYGDIKLGKEQDSPTHSSTVYFSMVLSSGVAVGLFVFGVSEPLWHQSGHSFAEAGYRSQDEIDLHAINMAVSNWGIAGWSAYTMVGLAVSLATHRFGLPLTLRSCFFPILGDWTWGWIGDCIDALTICVTQMGVSTSLGLGAIQMIDSFRYSGWINETLARDPFHVQILQNTAVWMITIVTVISVVSGVNGGVRIMSIGAMGLGTLLSLLVVFMDDTTFLLNLQVQEVGYYLQHSIFELNFWTDAFGQLEAGSGRATDGKSSDVSWMDSWMIFYQAWWVTWAAFVGVFLARISRGRRVREFLLFSLAAPVGVCLSWFCIWGGVGLRQHRQAKELEVLGGLVYKDADYFRVPDTTCYSVPQHDIVVNGTTFFQNHLLGVTPVCQFDSTDANNSVFRVLHSFQFEDTFGKVGLGPFLGALYLFTMAMFFVTSSDSATLAVDCLGSGSERKHGFTRSFWGFTEGIFASAVITSGGEDAALAVQAGSVIAGLPFIVVLMFLAQSITLFCASDGSDLKALVDRSTKRSCHAFDIPLYGGMFNVIELLFSCGRIEEQILRKQLPTKQQRLEFLLGLVVPFVGVWRLQSLLLRGWHGKLVAAAYGFFSVASVALFFGWMLGYNGLKPLCYISILIAGVILGFVRRLFRSRYRIHSHFVADYVGSILLWPQVIAQLRHQSLNLPKLKADDEGGSVSLAAHKPECFDVADTGPENTMDESWHELRHAIDRASLGAGERASSSAYQASFETDEDVEV